MKTLIKIFIFSLFIPCIAYAGAYRDTYEVEIQREVMQLQNEIDAGTASNFEKKRKAYLEKRLQKLTFVGIDDATFTTKVKKRNPIDSLASVSYKKGKVYFFTRIQNMDGSSVTHTWYYEGAKSFSKTFKIKSSTWRVWTSKTITKNFIGEWTVVVTDQNGSVLLERSIQVTGN